MNRKIIKFILIFLGIFFLLFSLSPLTQAKTIIVVGGNNDQNTTPPTDNNNFIKPTIDIIECPAGYDCIKEGDYNVFVASLTTLAERMETKAEFLSSILTRFDKKISLDESTIKTTQDIAKKAQANSTRIMKEYEDYKNQADTKLERNNIAMRNLTVQVNELRASIFWIFIVAFLINFVGFEIIQKLKPQAMFIWDWFIENVYPFKY